MHVRLLRRGRRLTGRDLQRLFAVTILVPGVLLTVVGLRAWQQDGELARQRLRERIDRAADLAADAVGTEIREWQAVLQRAQRDWPPTADVSSATLRRALTQRGIAVLVRTDQAGDPVWPRTQLAYQVASAAAPRQTIAVDHPAADRIATALNGRARARLAAGERENARRLYRDLAHSRGTVGAAPADLVGRHALARMALEDGGADAKAPLVAFYRDLVQGRWSLEETRYRFYSEWAQALVPPLPPEHGFGELRVIEARTLLLAEAARDALDASSPLPQGDILLVRDASTPELTLLISRAWLRETTWPRVLATVGSGFDVALRGTGGGTWFDVPDPPAGNRQPRVRRDIDIGGLRVQLDVAPRDPAALMADVTRGRTLTAVMLLLVVGLLAFGTYLTSHVVRRELEVARLQSDFVSAVSHEFRSPLTGIRQLGELLLRGRVSDQARRHEYYSRITYESARLGRLVENLLQAARIDEGRLHLQAERIETTDWLQAVIAEARTQPALRHATIEADIPAALPPLLGDRQALASALHNLIDNAVKYSPGAAPVRCEARAEEGHVTIRIRDSGVGMSEDDQRHAFERFRRGRGAITTQVKGTGLGLSLVHDIVRAHGGHVECLSRLGEGTTFSIRLAARKGA